MAVLTAIYTWLFWFSRINILRDNVNIYLDYNISFPQAALGDEIEVETIDGKTKLKLAAGIQSNTVLTIKKVTGVPFLNNPKQKGDQFVKINVITPTQLNDEERKLYKRLAEIQEVKLNKDNIVDKIKGVFTGANQ
ncbi:MAG: hypothetical protein MZU79_02105 [Anaerotruncus sp.]|nr:hypothetical protein [Anaerotruncus sp.]